MSLRFDSAAGLAELHRRIAGIEDRLRLQDLVVRYFIAVDDRNYDALASTFAEDAEWGPNAGRRAIVDSQRKAHRDMGPTLHSPDFILCEIDGPDAASGLVGAHCELSVAGQTLVGAMRYVDEYVRREGTWQIHRRRLDWVYLCPWNDVAESLVGPLLKRWPGRPTEPSSLPCWVHAAPHQ